MGNENTIKSFNELVDECAESKINVDIENTDATHAAYLIKTLFKYGKEHICILTGKFFEGVFGNSELQNEAVRFLKKKNSKLRVAFQEAVDENIIMNSSFIKHIIATPGLQGELEIWNASDAFPEITNHFTVMDNSAYRYEVNHDNSEAIGNFGDLDNAKILGSIFEVIINKSSRVAV